MRGGRLVFECNIIFVPGWILEIHGSIFLSDKTPWQQPLSPPFRITISIMIWREELQHYWFLKKRATTSRFLGSHHQHTQIIVGGDSEVSVLNIFFTYRLSSPSSYSFPSYSSSSISFDMKIFLLGCG